QEVDVLAVDLSGELRVRVQLRLPGPPVVPSAPPLDQLLDVAHRDAVLPTGRHGAGRRRLVRGQFLRPPGPGQSLLETVELGLRDVNPERSDRAVVCHW